jgi:hypothetical protein
VDISEPVARWFNAAPRGWSFCEWGMANLCFAWRPDMKRPYRPGRWRRWWNDLQWDVAVLLGFVVLAIVLRMFW